MSETAQPRLHRGHDRWVAGVCSGLAEYFNIDPLIVRIAFVAAAFLQGWGILLYIVLWFLMPPPDSPAISVGDFRSHLRAMNEDVRRIGVNLAGGQSTSAPASGSSTSAPPPPSTPPSGYPQRTRGGIVAGLILIALGAWFLLQNLGFLSWWRWDLFWPAVIIILGVALLVRRYR